MQDVGVLKSDGDRDAKASGNVLKEETDSTSHLPPDPKKPSCSQDSECHSLRLSFEHSNNDENKESALEYNTCTTDAKDKPSGKTKDNTALSKILIELLTQQFLESNIPGSEPKSTGNPTASVSQADTSKDGGNHSKVVSPSQLATHINCDTTPISGEATKTTSFNVVATDDVKDTSSDRPRGQGEADNNICSSSDTDDGPRGQGEMREESSSSAGETLEATDSKTDTHTEEPTAAEDVCDEALSGEEEESESTKPLPDSGSASSFPTLCSMSPSKPLADYSPCDSEMLNTCSKVSNVDIPNEDPKNSANNEDNSSSLPDTDPEVITASALPLANQSGYVHTVPTTRDDCSDSVVPSASAKSLVKPPVDMPLEIHHYQPLVSDEMESTASSHSSISFPRSLSRSFGSCTLYLHGVLMLTTISSGSSLEMNNCSVSNVTDILQDMWNNTQSYQPTDLTADLIRFLIWFLIGSLSLLCFRSLFRHRLAIFMLFLMWVVHLAKAIASASYRLVVRMPPEKTDNHQNPSTQNPSTQNPPFAAVSQSRVRDTETPVASTAPSAKPAANTAPIQMPIATRLPPTSLKVGSSTDQTLTADSGYHSPGPLQCSQLVTLSSSRANLSPEETSFPDSSGHSENSDVDSTGHGETPLPQVDDALVESATIQDSAPSEFVSIGCLLKIPHTQASRGEVPAVEESTPPNERTYEVTLPRRRTERARHPPQPQLINLPLIPPAAQEAEPNVQIAPLPVNQDGHLLAFNAVLERQQLPLDQNVPNEEPDFIPDVHNAAIPNDGDFLLHNVALVEPLIDMFQPGVLRNHPIVEQEDVLESRDHVYPSLPALPPRNERSLLVFPALPAMPSTETPVAFVPVTCVP